MSFWNKLFGKKKESPPQRNENSYFDGYRKALEILGLKTMSDLEGLVKPLLRPATKIITKPSAAPPARDSALKSHFGGQPYFEKGENWPLTKAGKPLDFIFQIYNTPVLEMPKQIALVQFFYSLDEFPWDTEDDGWKVKIYKDVHSDQMAIVEVPSELEKPKYCEVVLKPIQSLPDWEGIQSYSEHASNLSCVLNEEDPSETYRQICAELIGEQDNHSQLAGYPYWIQGESTPTDEQGNDMKLLFQIDSDDKAGLMWGDVGIVYVFYDEKTERIEFTLQCC